MNKVIFIFMLLAPTIYADTGWEGAVRKEHGSSVFTYQVAIATITSPVAQAATTVVSASVARPCLKIVNMSDTFEVVIGSHSGLNMSNGYTLAVSSGMDLSRAEFDQFKGTIFAFGQGTGIAVPSLSVLECRQ